MSQAWCSTWFFKTVIPLVLTMLIVNVFIGSATKLGFWVFVGWFVAVSLLVQLVIYVIRRLILRLNNGKLPPTVDRWL